MTTKLKILFIVISLILIGDLCASDIVYPVEIKKIPRSQATYTSPEETYQSIHSCSISGDASWCDETMTYDSLLNLYKLLEKNDIDRNKIFELSSNVKKTSIVDKFSYKDAVVLIVEDCGYNGSINRMPLTFVQEDNLWKQTNKYSSDSEINKFLSYTPPPQFLTPFTTSLHPSHWPQPWYAWLSEKVETDRWAKKQAEQVTFLCVITDGEDDDIELDDIVPESLQFNGTLAPQPWEYFSWRSFSRQSQSVVILPLGEHHPAISRRDFESWVEHDSPAPRDKTLLLVRFNLYQAMQSLPDLEAGKPHELFISGKLKDDRLFRASAEVTLVGPPISQENDLGNRPPQDHDLLLEQWWNR